MTRMQKLSMVIAGSIALGAVATASIAGGSVPQASEKPAPVQETPKPEGKRGFCGGKHRGMMKLHLKKKLNLTEQQIALIKPVMEKAKADIKALKGNDAMTREEKKTRVKAILEAARNDMNQFLTPAQRAQLDEWKAKRANRKSAPRPPVVSPTSA